VPDDPACAGQAFEPTRHVIEGLGHLIADLARRAAANGTGALCASASTTAATAGDAVASRSAWSVSSVSSASSSYSVSRASFSEERPNSAPTGQARGLKAHGNAPAGTSAGRSRPERSAHPAPSRRWCAQRCGVVGQSVRRDWHARSRSDPQRLGSGKLLVESICRSIDSCARLSTTAPSSARGPTLQALGE
jgi:hypothetical protein